MAKFQQNFKQKYLYELPIIVVSNIAFLAENVPIAAERIRTKDFSKIRNIFERVRKKFTSVLHYKY